MTTITIIVCITFIVILLFGLYKLSNYIYTKTIKKEQEELNTNLNHYSIFLLILGILLIVFSICAPFVFTRMSASEDFNFTETGQIGDTIGGLMSPFINMSAVIVTGLAFYMQYKANKLQVKIFNKQLQESKEQFNKEQEEQRKNTQLQQFENQFYEMLRLHKENVNEIEVENSGQKHGTSTKGRPAFLEMRKNLLKDIGNIENEKKFKTVYEKFFWSNNFHSYLGHYYRHLYHTVKFVVNQKEELISEEQKLNYLRILRAQLSNYEQEMLFYNWLGDFGKDWENEDNQFFTKYKMIQNLWYDRMYKNNFIKQKLKELVNRYKELGREDSLFEIGDNIDEKLK